MKRYVVLAPLPVDHDGERRTLRPGEILPAELAERWEEARSLFPLVDNEKLAEIDIATALEIASDDELLGAVESRGFTIKHRPKTAA